MRRIRPCLSRDPVGSIRFSDKLLGRHVCKGERGIAIFAPCPWTREVETNGDTETKSGVYFKVVHVFDVAQTDGEPLPDIDVPDVQAAADNLLTDLQRVASKRGIAINFVNLRAGHFGSSKGGIIDIANGHATGQQAKTLAHELAHESLHKDKATRPDGLTHAIAELEAESVAYVVCRHFGLDVEIRASRYIALWGGDSKALRESLERIANSGRAIIDDVEALDSRREVA